MKKDERFSRAAILLGEAAMKKLAASHAAVFGLGGVGSFAAEALARAGIGELTLVDHDKVSFSNINRQLPALTQTVGEAKTAVMAQRLTGINPSLKIHIIDEFYLPPVAEHFFAFRYDYVVDAIDTVTAKISLIQECAARQIPVISAMGAGNKLDPTAFRVADIFATKNDPLARVMRKELRSRGIQSLKVVYSEEKPINASQEENGRRVPGSVSFVPPVAGFILAGEAVKDLIEGSKP